MITDILLNVLAEVLGFVWDLLPEWDVEFPSGLTSMIATAKAFDGIAPITECLTIVGLLATLVGGLTLFRWGVKLTDWIMDVIP